jgi:3-hydroxybutyryl-CoA dehydratase
MEAGARATFSKTLTEADIAGFAESTGDTNPVHLDEEFAAASMFGQKIAHGLWSAGLVSAVLGTRLPGPGTIYLGQTLRFMKPVFLGDTITAEVEVVELNEAKRRAKLRTTCTNQAGETVLDGEALVLLPAG